MRIPPFLRAGHREMTGTAATVRHGPAFLCPLKDHTLALVLLAGGVWLWVLVHLVSPAVAADAALGTLEREVHDLVNEHRHAMGRRPLVYNAETVSQARRHSQAMASGQGEVHHHGVEERRAALLRSIEFTAFAENVAANSSAESHTAETAMQRWLKSAGHRRNIEGDFTLTGVGVARSATGLYFFTQIFLKTSDIRLP